ASTRYQSRFTVSGLALKVFIGWLQILTALVKEREWYIMGCPDTSTPASGVSGIRTKKKRNLEEVAHQIPPKGGLEEY
ncbi:MAG TPA: hypothetical protein VIQ75_07315, partial [Gammaproteobacteria bacterium]